MNKKEIQKKLDEIIDKLDNNLDFFNNDNELVEIRDTLQKLYTQI